MTCAQLVYVLIGINHRLTHAAEQGLAEHMRTQQLCTGKEVVTYLKVGLQRQLAAGALQGLRAALQERADLLHCKGHCLTAGAGISAPYCAG